MARLPTVAMTIHTTTPATTPAIALAIIRPPYDVDPAFLNAHQYFFSISRRRPRLPLSGIGSRRGTPHGATKIDDPLRFLEPERPVRRMSRDVVDWRIGSELAATLRRRPALDLSDKSSRHTFATCRWL